MDYPLFYFCRRSPENKADPFSRSIGKTLQKRRKDTYRTFRRGLPESAVEAPEEHGNNFKKTLR